MLVLESESARERPLQPRKTYVDLREALPQHFCEGRHDNVFGGEVASFHEIQPQLRAVDPLVMFDLTGQYRVTAALRRLIENVPTRAAAERQIFYTASGVIIPHIGRGERCARLGEER